MNDDPYVAHEVQPTRTVAELARADETLRDEIPTIALPLLILHGTEDKAAKPSGSQFFYENAEATDKTLRLYEGHYHDLLNDLGREQVMADITRWIDEHLPSR
jgi:alpha-beta hydrolase superfamily lysophospholipase